MTGKHSGAAKLWLLNLFGNAALLSAVYFWLLLPDAHGWQVVLSGLLALVILFCGLWLRTGSFAYFRLAEFREHAAVWRAFHHALHHILALALCAIPLGLAEWWLFSLRRFAPQFGVWFWQKIPFLRFGTPRQTYEIADWILVLMMLLIAALWLPLASTVSATGINAPRMTHSLRALRRKAYWLWLILLAILGGYLPYRILWWIPNLTSLKQQAWSAGLRFALAYFLVISAWVAILLVVGTYTEAEDIAAPLES